MFIPRMNGEKNILFDDLFEFGFIFHMTSALQSTK